MRIAVISTTIFPCPPDGYSGLEMVAYNQAEGLLNRGHEVLLVAPRGSLTNCELHPTTQGEPEGVAYPYYLDKISKCDIIIDHSWGKYSYLGKKSGKITAPILGWLHAPTETMYSTPPPVEKPCLVAISNDQASAVLGWLGVQARTCYNGVDFSFYKNDGSPRSDRFLFLARISKLKGPHIAIQACKEAGVGLDVVGDDTLVEDPSYVAKIKSMCDGEQIKYHGPASRLATIGFYSRAKALLHCNHIFREPFGLTLIEAQACGTPVIAFNYGSTKELGPHLYTTFDELVSLLKLKLLPSDVSKFSLDNHLNTTEQLCQEALQGGW